jgi:hypothetical protein
MVVPDVALFTAFQIASSESTVTVVPVGGGSAGQGPVAKEMPKNDTIVREGKNSAKNVTRATFFTDITTPTQSPTTRLVGWRCPVVRASEPVQINSTSAGPADWDPEQQNTCQDWMLFGYVIM